MTIFPNPATNTLHISGHAVVKSVDVLDMTGRKVADLNPRPNGDVDVSDLVNGNYVLRIHTGTAAPIYKRLTVLH